MELCENIKCKSPDGLTWHHLYPRKYRYVVDWSKVTPSEANAKMRLCGERHSFLHWMSPNCELALHYNTRIKVLNYLIEKDEERVKWNKRNNGMASCENINCESTDNLTKHHLFPKGYRAYGSNPTKKCICLCRHCHTILHKLKSNFELASFYNTKEKVVGLLVSKTMPVNSQVIMIRQEPRLALVG